MIASAVAEPTLFLLVPAVVVVAVAIAGGHQWVSNVIAIGLLGIFLTVGVGVVVGRLYSGGEVTLAKVHGDAVPQRMDRPAVEPVVQQYHFFTSQRARRNAPFIVIMPVALLAVFGINKWTCRKYEPARG